MKAKQLPTANRKARTILTIQMLAASAMGLGMPVATHAVTGTWTGGGAGTWDTSNTNWSGVGNPAWDTANGPANLALFNTAGDAASISGTVVPGAITFSQNATVNGAGILGFGTNTSTMTIDVATGRVGTINAGFLGVGIAGNDGNKIAKTGAGKLVLTGNTVLVGDANTNFTAGFTVEGGGELEIQGGLKAASTLQSNRSNFTNTVGLNSSGNILRIAGPAGTTVYAGGLSIGGGTFGNNQVIISRPGTLATPSYLMAGNGAQLNEGVGAGSSNNVLEISNGAYLRNTQGGGTNTWTIGTNAGANNNSVLITGAGSTLDRGGGAGSALNVGAAGDGNSVTVQNGGTLIPRRLAIGMNGGDNNFVRVTGAGSFLNGNDSQPSLGIGSNRAIDINASVGGVGNYLQIDSGGTATFELFGGSRGYNVGAVNGADNNYILVDDTGSTFTLRMGQPLSIGGVAGTNNGNHSIINTTASGNHFDIFDGAKSFQNTVFLQGVGSAINLGDGGAIAELEVRESFFGGYGAGVVLANADSRLNINNGRLNAGDLAGSDLVTGYVGSIVPSALGPAFTGPGKINLLGDGYFNVDTSLDASGNLRQITVGITGVGDLINEADGELVLTSALNNYTGNTSVLEGILELQNPFLADTADVLLSPASILDLTFAGIDDINAFSIDGGATYLMPGIYDVGNLPAFITGLGQLRVRSQTPNGGNTNPPPTTAGVPEPATASLLAMAGVLGLRRRKRQA